MKHLGDITKLNGAEIPVVDCITGGSPCQDLSVAGKRAGLDGERSGLFMEQIRIVKQMRKKEMQNGRAAELVRPRWMVWENVPGAFSSNGGKDFQAVLTEIVRIVEPECPDVPMPKDGKWSKAGCLYDELGRWSIAWRVHDAQFWGVPQRRKRIALVADFGGMCAPEVLFERKGLSRNTEPSETERKESAERTESGVGGSSLSFQERAGKPGGAKEYCSNTIEQEPCQPSITKAYSIQGNTIDRDAKQNGGGISSDVAHTLNGTDRHGVAGFDGSMGSKAGNIGYAPEQSITVKTTGGGMAVYSEMTCGALCARDYKGVGSQYVDEGKCVVCP